MHIPVGLPQTEGVAYSNLYCSFLSHGLTKLYITNNCENLRSHL